MIRERKKRKKQKKQQDQKKQKKPGQQNAQEPQLNNIVNPHDKLFRNTLTNLRVAEDFLKQFLPAHLQQQISWKSLKVQKGNFVDTHLKDSTADVLYEVKLAEERAYIYLLIEHQSEPDKLMPFRLLRYMVRIMEQHLHQNPHPKNPAKPLPLIIPLVFYTGYGSYYYSNNIHTLVDAPEKLVKEFFLKPFQLINLKNIKDQDMAEHIWAGLIEATMKYRLVKLRGMISLFVTLLRQVDAEGNTDLIRTLFEYIFATMDITDAKQIFERSIKAVKPETEAEMITMADWLRQEGREEGIQKGKLEEAQEIAARLLNSGAELEFVAKMTKLSPGEVERLKIEKSRTID